MRRQDGGERRPVTGPRVEAPRGREEDRDVADGVHDHGHGDHDLGEQQDVDGGGG